MGLFTGAADFFRGAFGEDDEEKKRRKQQETQAASQRQQAQKPKQQTVEKPKDITQFFNQPKPNQTTVTKPVVTQPKPVEQVATPAPRVALPDQDFKAFTAEKKVRKFLPDQVKVNVDRSYSTNKDKFVADFDKLNPDVRKVYYEKLVEQVKSGDQAALNAYNAIQETNRAPKDSKLQNLADAASVPGRNILRVSTGVAQGVSGLADLASPGTGTNRVSKGLDRLAKNQDKSAKDAGVETAYKVGNVVGEIASYFIPTTIAAKIASKLPKGALLTENMVEFIAKNVDDAGDAGKVRKFLADRMRKGWSLDKVIEEATQSAKYTGENASKGNDTSVGSVALDVGTAVGGSLLFPGKKLQKLLDGDDTDEVAGTAISTTAQLIEQRLAKAASESADEVTRSVPANADEVFAKVEDGGVRNASKEELEAITNDIERPAIDRKPAIDELARRNDEAVTNANIPTPSKPAFQHKKDIQKVVQQAEDGFNEFVNKYPNLTPQEIEIAREIVQKKALKLIDDLQTSRQAVVGAVDDQASNLDNTVKSQQATNEAVQVEQAAANPNGVSTASNDPVPTSPEVAANNAYTGKSTEDVLFDTTKKVEEPGRLSLPQLFSPDRIIRENITQPLEGKINDVVGAAQTSSSKTARGIGRLFTGFSREAGTSAATQNAKMNLRGGVEYGKLQREAIADLSKDMDTSSTDRVWATLDPEHAVRKGLDPNAPLSPKEQVLQEKLKTIIDNTTAENLRRGLIDPAEAANGSYIKRSYTIYDGDTEVPKFERGFRTELMGQFKGRKLVSDEMVDAAITDPTYLVGKKTAESNAIWAMQDYGNYLVKSGTVSDVAKPGYTKLPDTPVFGEARGKFVPRNLAEDFSGFQYNHAMTTAFNDLITAYDRLGIRQAKKQLLTIFNPAVRLGNQVSNRIIFAQLNGVNPLQFNKEFYAVNNMIKNNDPIYREAVQQGLTGIDISQADFFANRISSSANGDKNVVKKALDYVKTSYSGADDQARVAAYSIYRKRGYNPEDAARMVQRGFQDYKSVGFFYDMAAKTPVIGNAFVRFAADSVRIAKNAAVDHPLRTLSTVAAWSAFTNGMSVLSGESEMKGDNPLEQAKNLVTGESKSDVQKEREGRFGAPKIPFTDISATVQTPYGEVNVARFMPWYSLNEIGDVAISKFLPIATSPVKLDENGKPTINPAGFNDPLLGQIPQWAMDRDFRNKSISDPEMNPDKPDAFRKDPLSEDEKNKNVLRWLFNNNAPLGKEIDQTASAYKKEAFGGVIGDSEGSDIYNKERSPNQSWLRNFGLKVEQQGEKQRDKREGMETYIAELEQIDRDMDDAKMSDEAREAYKRLTGYYKMRKETDNEFSPGDKRKIKAEVYNFGEDKWKEYAAHPELYDLMVRKKQREVSTADPKTGKTKPLQPEFDERLSEGFRRQLVQNKMVVPGDDAELDQRMYSAPEWDYYQNLKDEYKTKAKAYYPERGDEVIDDETVKHQDAQFPTKPDILKKYGAQYGLFGDGKGNKPEFTDAVKAAKEAYNIETLKWTNNERKARGLDAINWEMWNNPTFGYDSTPSSGFGGGGDSRPTDPTAYINKLGELSNYSASTKRYDPVTAAAMPQLAQMFASLQAGSGGSRRKPPIGASASGR